jgi:hypothetical protein
MEISWIYGPGLILECLYIDDFLNSINTKYNLLANFIPDHYTILDPNSHFPKMLWPFLMVRNIQTRLNSYTIASFKRQFTGESGAIMDLQSNVVR